MLTSNNFSITFNFLLVPIPVAVVRLYFDSVALTACLQFLCSHLFDDLTSLKDFNRYVIFSIVHLLLGWSGNFQHLTNPTANCAVTFWIYSITLDENTGFPQEVMNYTNMIYEKISFFYEMWKIPSLLILFNYLII